MRSHSRYLGALAAIAMLCAFTSTARADFLAKGRTRAIRQGIAKHINANPVAHVTHTLGQPGVQRVIKPSEIRIRSKRLPSKVSVVGAAERAVSWRLASGMLAGTAQATTPVVPNGGKFTQVSNVQYTVRPRGGPPVMAQQNSRFSERNYHSHGLERARGYAPGTVGHALAVERAGFYPDSIGLEAQAGARRGTAAYNNYWSGQPYSDRRGR